MTESTQIAIAEINESNAATIFKGDGLYQFFKHIQDSVNEVPDLTTKRGRDRIASLAAQVSRSKTAVEKPGRDNLRRVKELPKALEAELRDFVNKCDALRDEVRKPLTDWEAEQARLAEEAEAAVAKAEAAEKKRQQDELAAQEAETKLREADKDHKRKINGEALAELVAVGLDEQQAKAVIVAIATRTIPHVSISY